VFGELLLIFKRRPGKILVVKKKKILK